MTGALPGYTAINHIEAGDLIRAVTAYREVLSGAPMWQQVISYSPRGTVQLKRLVFRTEGARYSDVRDAIASHRADEGGNDSVTLVVERPLNATRASQVPVPSDVAPPTLEPLSDVILRDLKLPRSTADDMTKTLEKLSPAERARRLLGVEDDLME